MTKIRTLFCAFLALSFSCISFAQPVFPTSEANIDQTVSQIFKLYESQIDLSYQEVFDFVSQIVAGAEPECGDPYPSIKNLSPPSISFYWDSVPSADYYQTAYLNLNNGDRDFAETPNTGITFDNMAGLVLFGFNTVCEDGDISLVDIIIADIEILIQVPPGEEGCDCDSTLSLPLYSTATSTQSAFSIQWPGTCDQNRYQLRVDGTVDNGGGSFSSYSSELSFIRNRVPIPHKFYLLSACNDNATTTLGPLYMGGQGPSPNYDPFYDIFFSKNYLTFNIPPSNLHIDDLILDVCQCRKKGKNGEEKGKGKGERDGTIDHLLTDFNLSPNPGSDHVQVSFSLEAPVDVKIDIYDVLGKKVKTLIQENQKSSGQYQYALDVQSWPKGIYTFHLSSAQQNKVLLFSKN